MAREIWFIVREIRKTGIATIIVDKNLYALLSLINRAVILVKGQVVFNGSAEALHQQEELVQQYLGV